MVAATSLATVGGAAARAERVREPAPGPCERHLVEVTARGAPWLRAAIAGLCGGFGLVAYDGTAVLVTVAVAGAIAVLSGVQALLRPVSPTWLYAANAALSAALGLSQLYLGAQPYTGWIVALASVMSISCYFEWPDRTAAAHVLSALTVGGYTAGCVLAGGGLPWVPTTRMVVQAALGWAAFTLIRRAARACDALDRRAAQRRTAAAAARAQRAADRAYLAMLHDTASTTFLMVSTSATDDFDWLPAQARRDLRLLSSQVSRDAEVDLAELLESLADYPGLEPRLDVRGPLPVPAEQAFAIYHGVREALSNVRGYAGDTSPVLTARGDGGRVEVRVSDSGRGFSPADVPPHRRGLSHSIVARMAEAGGRADVTSAPGEGTTVTWTWAHD